MDFRADLHMHSYFSDGSNSPQELLYLAKEKKLSAISITDHDTIDAYDDKLFEIADELGIRLLVGSEISSQLFNKTVHILAYGIDLHSKSFKIFLEKLWEKRRDRNIQILEKLSIKNIDISYFGDHLNCDTRRMANWASPIGAWHPSIDLLSHRLSTADLPVLLHPKGCDQAFSLSIRP